MLHNWIDSNAEYIALLYVPLTDFVYRRIRTHCCYHCLIRSPFLQDVDSETAEPSDWDRYAAEEYEILVAEETATEHLQEG